MANFQQFQAKTAFLTASKHNSINNRQMGIFVLSFRRFYDDCKSCNFFVLQCNRMMQTTISIKSIKKKLKAKYFHIELSSDLHKRASIKDIRIVVINCILLSVSLYLHASKLSPFDCIFVNHCFFFFY